MKVQSIISLMIFALSAFLWSGCKQGRSAKNSVTTRVSAVADTNYGGFKNQIEWGKHLVTVSGCNECHTPKVMTAMGPVPDTSLLLSGHPAKVPPPDVNRKEIEGKGLAVTSDLTAWVGPWGISYASNLTPDATGLGNWSEDQFIYAIRNGKYKGVQGSRNLLPPMPWQELRLLSNSELKAIFAYLKSIKPVHNQVPEAVPPVMAAKHSTVPKH